MNVSYITEGTVNEVRSLLEKNDLPVRDLDEERVLILVARVDEQVIGCIGIEQYGSDALFRSLAVEVSHRNAGTGAALVGAALSRVKADGAKDVFGVTTTAAGYLERFGFAKIDRASVSGALVHSSQLTGVCPENSETLLKRLKPLVLFMCVHNAGRSQMAAAFLRRIAGDRIDVRSAGSEPADQLNPAVVAAMTEVGLNISAEQPKLITFDLAKEADVVVTMGCGDACPVFPGKAYLDWKLIDPAEKSIEEVRTIRDDIEYRIQGLFQELTR